ncbi:hypothetical protein IJ732_08115, partial [bacterium]|nr:hypothetical protein [bacterium]
AFAKEVHDKIKNDPSYKIDDVIKDLKQLDGFAGSDKKGIQKHLASYYADSANFAADFYLKAQKEGKLSQALEIVPPTESIQKRLSLGKETKAITELFKQLDDNVSPNAETKAKKYGITEERAKELDARFEEITRGWNKRATCGEALSITIFPEIFEKGNYTDKEKLYLLSVVHEHSGTKKNYTSTIEDFTKVFRAMSSADEEKYFPEILKLYGKI